MTTEGQTLAGSENAGRGNAYWSSLMFAAQVAAAGGAFVTTLVLARVLGPEGRGTFAFAITVAAFVAIVGQLGLAPAMAFVVASEPPLRGRAAVVFLRNALVATSVVGLLAAGTMVLLAERLPSDGTQWIWTLPAALGFCITVFDGANAFQNAEQRFGPTAGAFALVNLTPAIIVPALALSGSLTVGNALATWGLARITLGGAIWLTALRRSPRLPSSDLPRRMRAFGRRALPASLAGVVTLRADQWVLGIAGGAAPLGVYAVAVSVADPIVFAAAAVQRVIFPRVARDPARTATVTAAAMRGLIVIVVALTLLVGPLGYVLIPVVFGNAFEASRTPFLCLLPGGLGFAFLAVISAAISASGHPGRASLVELTTGAVMIGLDLVLIPPFGATGVAIASTVAYTAGGAMAIAMLRRLFVLPIAELVPRRSDVAAVTALARQQLVKH